MAPRLAISGQRAVCGPVRRALHRLARHRNDSAYARLTRRVRVGVTRYSVPQGGVGGTSTPTAASGMRHAATPGNGAGLTGLYG